MRVEWTSYDSPVGLLTLVECEAGPLVIEYPNRAVTIKWAVRLRAAVPELHIAQGSCRLTSCWLNNYFAGSPTPAPSLDHLKHWFDLSPAQMAVLRTLRKNPPGRDPIVRRPRTHHPSSPSPDRMAGCRQSSGHSGSLPPRGGEGWGPGWLRWRACEERWLLDHESSCRSRVALVICQSDKPCSSRLDSGPLARSDSIDKIVPKHDLMACNTLCLPSISEQALAAGRFDPRGFF